MKSIILIICLFLLSCTDESAPAITYKAPKVVNTWHLKSKILFYPEFYDYQLNDVVLQFDTSTKLLTISGNKDSVFYHKGTFAYNIKYNDTAYSHPNPRDPSSLIYRVYTKLEIPSLTDEYLILQDSTIILDPFLGLADDETFFTFSIR